MKKLSQNRLNKIRQEKALLKQKIKTTEEILDLLEDIQVIEGQNHSRENIESLKKEKKIMWDKIENLEEKLKL